MAIITLIDAATAATDSDRFEVRSLDERATVFCSGLAGIETVTLQFSQDDGSTWVTLLKDAANVECSTADNSMTIYGIGVFRVQKGITASPVTATLHRFKNN